MVGIDSSANRGTHLPWGGHKSTSNRISNPSAWRRQYSSDELSALLANRFQSMFNGSNAIFNSIITYPMNLAIDAPVLAPILQACNGTGITAVDLQTQSGRSTPTDS